MPLLHGASALHEGETSLGAGVGGTFATGALAGAVVDARGVGLPNGTTTGGVSTTRDEATYARGALALAAGSSGLLPWVSGRQGLGQGNEAGIGWYGRAVRLDARHAFAFGRLDLSIGGGASVVAPRADRTSPDLAGLDLNGMRGYGADVPVLVGTTSRAGIVSLWAGPRAGFEKLGGTVVLGTSSGESSLDATRWYAGAVAGLSLGFRHLRGAIEFDASWQHASGSVGAYDVVASGVTIAPAAALVGSF